MQPAGFLIPRPCRNEAAGGCSLCGRLICAEHTTLLPDAGPACTACAAARGQGPEAEEEQLRGYYGYHPESYHGGGGAGTPSYTEADYRAFETAGGPEEGPAQESEEDLRALQEDLEGS